MPVKQRGFVDQFLAQARNLRDILGRIALNKFLQLLEAAGVLLDILAVNEAGLDQNVNEAIDEGNIGAGFERQKNISHHRGFGNPWVGNNQRLAWIYLQPLAEDGVIIGNVGAD